jgi:hypothetical protein
MPSSRRFQFLGQRQCILYIDAEIPDGILNLGVPEQDLNCSEITGGLINDGGLGTTKRMRTIILTTKANR